MAAATTGVTAMTPQVVGQTLLKRIELVRN
jgi:hypothetical protein